MAAIFTLFCIVFIDSGNKHKILNKMTWKLPKKKILCIILIFVESPQEHCHKTRRTLMSPQE